MKALGDAKKDIENLIKNSSGLDKGMMQALRLNLVRINNELKKANSGQMMQKFGQMIAKPFVGAAQTLGKGLAVLGSVKRTFDVTNGVFQSINGRINQFARMQMSITAERAGYGRQLRGAGMNFGEMMGALAAGRSAGMEDKAVVNQMVGLQTELSKARWGEGSMIESAGRWGISTFNSDGSVRTANEMMVQFSRKLRSLGDDMEKLQFLTHIGFSPDKMEYVQNYEKEAEHAKMVRANPHMQTIMDKANILDESGYNARVDKYTKIEQRRREILNQNAIDKGLWSGLERSFNPENWFFNDWTAREKGVRGANAEIANDKMNKLLEAMLKEMEKNGGDRQAAMETAMASPDFSVETLTGLVDALKQAADEKNDPQMIKDFEAAFKDMTGITLDTRTNMEKMCEKLNELCKVLVSAFESIVKKVTSVIGGEGKGGHVGTGAAVGGGLLAALGLDALGGVMAKGGRKLSAKGGFGGKVGGWGMKKGGRFLSKHSGKLGLLGALATIWALNGDDSEEGADLAEEEEYATGGRYPRKGGVDSIDSNVPLAKYARGGRSAKRAIFGEAGPEYAIPVEHSKNTADLLNQASQESGFGNPRIGKGDVVPEYAEGGRFPKDVPRPTYPEGLSRRQRDLYMRGYYAKYFRPYRIDENGFMDGTNLKPEEGKGASVALRNRLAWQDALSEEDRDAFVRGNQAFVDWDNERRRKIVESPEYKQKQARKEAEREARRRQRQIEEDSRLDLQLKAGIYDFVGTAGAYTLSGLTFGGINARKFRSDFLKNSADKETRRRIQEAEENNPNWQYVKHGGGAALSFAAGTPVANAAFKGGTAAYQGVKNSITGAELFTPYQQMIGNAVVAGTRAQRVGQATTLYANAQRAYQAGGAVTQGVSRGAVEGLERLVAEGEAKLMAQGVNPNTAVRMGQAVVEKAPRVGPTIENAAKLAEQQMKNATQIVTNAGKNVPLKEQIGVAKEKAGEWLSKAFGWAKGNGGTMFEASGAASTVAVSVKQEAAKQKALEEKRKKEEEERRIAEEERKATAARRKRVKGMKDEDFLNEVRTRIAGGASDKEVQEMFNDRGLWAANSKLFKESKAFMGDGKTGDNELGVKILAGLGLAQENANASMLAGKGVDVTQELKNLKDKYAIAWKESGRSFDKSEQRVAIAARQAGNKDATTFPEMKHYFDEGDKYGEKQVALLAKIAAELAKKEENKGLSPDQIREKAEGERRKQFLKDMTAEDLRNRFKYNDDGSIITDEKEIAKRRDEAFQKEGVEVGMSQKFKSEQKEALDAFIKQNPHRSLGANIQAFATENDMSVNDTAELLAVGKKFEEMSDEEKKNYKQTRAYQKESGKKKREASKANREKERGERADNATDEEIRSALKGSDTEGLAEYYMELRDKVRSGETLSDKQWKKYDETRQRIGRNLLRGSRRAGARGEIYGINRRPRSTRREDSAEHQRIMDEWNTKHQAFLEKDKKDQEETHEPSMWGQRLLDKREQEAKEAAAKEEAEKKGGKGRRSSTPAPRRSGRSPRLPAFSLTGGRGISITGGKGLSSLTGGKGISITGGKGLSSLTGGKGISITGGKGLSKLSELGNSYEPESGAGSLSRTAVKARQAEDAAESGNKAASAAGGGQGGKGGSGSVSVTAPITVHITVQGNMDTDAAKRIEANLSKVVTHVMNDSAVSVVTKVGTR